MKLTIKRNDLVSALTVVKQAASNKGSSLPILANVAIRAFEKSIELTCTDLDTTIRTKVDATVQDKGDTTVRVSILYDLVHSFPGDADRPLQIDGFKEHIKLSCGDSQYKLGTLSIDEFPPTAKLKDAEEFKLDQATLRRMLSATSFCVSRDEARPILGGSLLSLNGALTVVGCDGRRLALLTADLPDKSPKTQVVVPGRAVNELLRLLENDEEKNITILVAKNAVEFRFNDITLTTKLIEGAYPDYRKVVPDTSKLPGIPIGRADLLGALKRSSFISDTCTLDFKGQTLTIRSRANDKGVVGEAVESLLIPKAKDNNVAFNTDFLVTALAAVDDDEVLFHSAGPNSPAVLTVKSKPWISVTAALVEPAAKPEAPAPTPAAK